jgi:hypothetical protein
MSSLNAQFEAQMVEFVANAKLALQETTKMILLEIGIRIVNRSPVGDPPSWKRQPPWLPKNYLPGTFKNNWQLTVDMPGTDTFFTPDPSGNLSITRIALAIPRWPVGHTYYYSNNLPYAQALENGWSRQAPPAGIVALTTVEFQSIVEEMELRYSQGERPVTKAIP